MRPDLKAIGTMWIPTTATLAVHTTLGVYVARTALAAARQFAGRRCCVAATATFAFGCG